MCGAREKWRDALKVVCTWQQSVFRGLHVEAGAAVGGSATYAKRRAICSRWCVSPNVVFYPTASKDEYTRARQKSRDM